LGLLNTLAPATVASDWLWGWGILAAGIAFVAAFKPSRRLLTCGGLIVGLLLVVGSYRVQANPWKSQFNSKFAEKLLRENATSGDAIYAGNLILAQAAIDTNDIENAKRYLIQAATTPGAKR